MLTVKNLVEIALEAYDSGRRTGQPTYDTFYRGEVTSDILDSLREHLTAEDLAVAKVELDNLPETWK